MLFLFDAAAAFSGMSEVMSPSCHVLSVRHECFCCHHIYACLQIVTFMLAVCVLVIIVVFTPSIIITVIPQAQSAQ